VKEHAGQTLPAGTLATEDTLGLCMLHVHVAAGQLHSMSYFVAPHA
jgi:hypothetical protein